MQGFRIDFKADEPKESLIKKLDAAIEEARSKMNKSIEENGGQAPITIKLSQELDPLIVDRQKIFAYGC